MLDELPTEGRHPRARDLDLLDTGELVRRLVGAERETLAAVEAAAPAIAAAVERVAARLAGGGRLFYAGAGTSGRLGALDAAEGPPTFGTPPERVQALLAGGPDALLRAVEGAEDDREAGAAAVRAAGLGPADVLLAIAASGRTPFCGGARDAARAAGALGLALCCVAEAPLARAAELAIELLVGPEMLSGSTRLKAGTATKIALNALSTGVMVRLGRTYGDLMVEVQATNLKLRRRALRLLTTLTPLSGPAAESALAAAGGELKTAVVAARLGLSPEAARERLQQHGGHLRSALGEA
jgi:N-acetylmuramic acid 6-phosphate etherase